MEQTHLDRPSFGAWSCAMSAEISHTPTQKHKIFSRTRLGLGKLETPTFQVNKKQVQIVRDLCKT